LLLKSKNLNKIKKYLLPQRFGVLCTNDKGQPYSSLISFVMSDDTEMILFATNKNTHKYKNMMEESRVSFLIDNRSGTESDFENAIAATAIGYAIEINENEKINFLKILLDKHQSLGNFLSSESTSLFRIDVKKYVIVSNFQNVEEIYLD
jgi:heme iron utilization protein